MSEEYFKKMIARDAIRPELKLLKKPCHDCAVTCGFYENEATELKKYPELAEKVSKKWFCHNNRDRACRGNADYQGVSW